MLAPDEKKVLRALTKEASFGYTLLSRTGLTTDQLQAAVGNLVDRGLVGIQGEGYGEQFLKAFLYVPPAAQGKAEYYLADLDAR